MPTQPEVSQRPIQVWCDVGGTFTDCFVVDAQGRLHRTKVLSHGRVPGRIARWVSPQAFADPSRQRDPGGFWVGAQVVGWNSKGKLVAHNQCVGFDAATGILTLANPIDAPETMVSYELRPGVEAPVLAARWLLHIPLSHAMPPLHVRLGTTRGTNALLTRTGSKTVFATTQGFADLLEIGYQERPELFVLQVRKRAPLYDRVVEIRERLDAAGNVLQPLDLGESRRDLQRMFDDGYRSLAICLLHAYRNPTHEQTLARLAESIGFSCVCFSSDVAPVIKAVSRGETTVVDAYLTPIVRSYLERVRAEFGEHPTTQLRVMTSSGGLVDASKVYGRETVLSGPAGGAVALEAMARHYGFPKLIGLDMGGTSTDVCRIDGQLQLEHETVKAGVRMRPPTLAIHTVASGGGSICWFDSVQLRVGPQSAGSDPGPACYGRGGPLTITDLNLLQGRIDPERFPIPLDRQAAQDRIQELLAEVGHHPLFQGMDAARLVAGLRRIANEQMAAAVRAISMEQGADPREHVLAGFGGAAGQHICEIAELLGMDRILDHPDAGLLSALGMGLAQIKRSRSVPVYTEVTNLDWHGWEREREKLESQIGLELVSEGISDSEIQFRSVLNLRYVGTEGSLQIDWRSQSLEALIEAYEAEHRSRFGYARPGRGIEVTELWVEGASREATFGDWSQPTNHERPARSSDQESDQEIVGPAMLHWHGSTTVIDPGWVGLRQSDGALILQRSKRSDASPLAIATERIDPVLREILAQRVAAIADQMGIVLEQTAISVNVKQRRDFSCAVFHARGELIANAPHVPVHLGAMSQTVQAMMQEFPEMHPGDCFVTNDPYRGGSHLPDITVVTPVFASKSAHSPTGPRTPDFFVASRAHHAEIGGVAPGSMAPTSTRLGEEGVLIPPMYLMEQGVDRSGRIERLLRESPYPSRSTAENMADLAAQQAANLRGAAAMQSLADSVGCDRLQGYLEAILEAAEAKTRRWIASLEQRDYHRVDHMDDGTRIEVRLRKVTAERCDSLDIDFTGTGPVSLGNLNANPGIVTAAVMYCIRCAIADTMPLNSGVMRAVHLTIPPGILNPRGSGPKSEWPAVAGGNVETSQRVVDCLLGALGLAAASQGTMNNFLFGNARFGYYETIGGGTGACPTGPGEHAVHSHMTNTRLTDVEVLESRYPVRLVEFSIRRGSGGTGRFSGGDGMVRQVLALEPLDVSLVTSRRGEYPPFGLAGGEPGALGENWLVHADGSLERLSGSCQLKLAAGDAILLKTPGGGGYGSP